MNPSDEQAASSRSQSAPNTPPADSPAPGGNGAPATSPEPASQNLSATPDTALPPAPAQVESPPAVAREEAPSAAEPQAAAQESPLPVQDEEPASAAEDEGEMAEDSTSEEPLTAGQAAGSARHEPPPGRALDHQPVPGRGKLLPGDEPLVVVRYGKMNFIGVFRHSLEQPPRRGVGVVIRTQRGVELGEVLAMVQPGQEPPAKPAEPAAEPVPYEMDETTPCGADCAACIRGDRLETLMRSGEQTYDYHRANRILRLSTPEDNIDQGHLDQAGREKLMYCKEQANQLHLPMRMVAVEHLFGGERLVFYFTSESRVDFRELVRRLAGQYRTRIEMRQIGARDEARLIGDYERCGQRCCCQQFLGTLQPVSIRMAKTQKATLDPTKISGRCGRLMCCLRYEDETYEDLRRRLPKRNTFVRTALGVGKVLDTQILAQLVMLADGTGGVAAVENEAILERNVPEPAEPVAWAAAAQSARQSAPKAGHAGHGQTPADDFYGESAQSETAEAAEPAETVAAGADDSKPTPSQDNIPAREQPAAAEARPPRPARPPERPPQERRRGPDRRPAPPPPAGPPAETAAPTEAPAGPEGEKSKRRKRRRRRGRGGGQGAPGEGQPQRTAGPEGGAPRPSGAPSAEGAPGPEGTGANGPKKRRRRRRRGKGHGGGGPEGSGGAPPAPGGDGPPAQ